MTPQCLRSHWATIGLLMLIIGPTAARPQSADSAARLPEWNILRSEAMVMVNYDRWNDQRDPLRETQLIVRHNTNRGVGIARLSHSARFGLRDDKLDVEAYPTFRGGYAALGASYAPNARLYARSTLTAELFANLQRRLEVSLGFRRLNFASPVNVFTGSVGAYEHEFLFTARVYHAAGGAAGTTGVLSARRYFADERQYIGINLATGSLPEYIRTAADIVTTSSRSIGAEGVFTLRTRWLLTLRAGAGRDDTNATGPVRHASGTIGLGVRF
jgi:YaiO family outer membrane protein